MRKKILGIASSERLNSDSTGVLKEVLEKLNVYEDVKLIELKDYRETIGCVGCLECYENSMCCKSVNQNLLLSIVESDILILSSPIYYGNINGLMKMFVEACYSLKAEQTKQKRIYFISTSTQEDQTALAVSSLLPWVVKSGMVFMGSMSMDQLNLSCRAVMIDRFIEQITEQNKQQFNADFEFTDIQILNQTYSILSKYEIVQIV